MMCAATTSSSMASPVQVNADDERRDGLVGGSREELI